GAMILMTQAAMERFLPLTWLLRAIGHPEWIPVRTIFSAWLEDIWSAVAIAFLIAWACGTVAGRLERHGWDIAAACRGGLIGFSLASLFGVAQHAIFGPERESLVANWVA